MSERHLLSKYTADDNADIDNWLTTFAGQAAAKPAAPAPVAPTTPGGAEGGGFFNRVGGGIRSMTGGEKTGGVTGRGQEGVMPSLGRAAASIPEQFSAGLTKLGQAWQGGQKPVEADLPLVGKTTIPGGIVRAGTALIGAAETVFPVSKAGGSLYGDFMEMMTSYGEANDEFLQRRITNLEATPGNDPGKVMELAYARKLLLMPPAERLKLANERGQMAGEVMSSLIPGYTMGVKLAGKAVAPAVAAGQAAHAARAAAVAKAAEEAVGAQKAQTAQLALPAQAGPSRVGGAIPQPASTIPPPTPPPSALVPWNERSAPERLRWLQTHPESKQALEDWWQENRFVQPRPEPGLARVEAATPPPLGPHRPRIEPPEAPGAAGVPAKLPVAPMDPQQAAEVVKATEGGGATYSVTQRAMYPGVSGYAVGIAPERSVIVDQLTPDVVMKFAQDNAELLAKDGMYFGTWKDDVGKVHIDISQIVPGRAEALAMGKKFKQQAVWDFKNMAEIRVDEKMVKLEHYSPKTGLTTIEPSSFGTGQAGREAKRAGEPGFLPRSSYYLEGTRPEARFAAMSKYTTEVPEAQIFDLGSDAGKALMAEVGGDATKAEALIRERGFIGYRNSALNVEGSTAPYAQTMGNAVSMFEPAKVAEAGIMPPVSVRAYHGTSTTFADYKGSTFFAEKPETANYYAAREMLDSGAPAGPAPQIRPVQVVLDRPASQQAWESALDMVQGDRELAEELLKSKNFDGVTFQGDDTGKGLHYLVFDPAKSVVSAYGEVGKPLASAYDAAVKRLTARLKELGQAFTDETGAFQFRGSFVEGWEKNVKFMNDLGLVGSHIIWEGARTFKLWSAAMIHKFGDQITPQLKAIYEIAQRRLEGLASGAREGKKMVSAERVYEAMREGEPAWQWYDGALTEFKTMFGPQAETFIDVYAAVSPVQEAATGNITMAFKAMDFIMTGKRNPEILFKPEDGFIGAHRANLNRVLRGEPLSGPKVGEFARAIRGDRDATVVDRWMGRFFNFAHAEEGAPRGLNVREQEFIKIAIESAAKELGLDNRSAQAALWAVSKATREGKEISEVSQPLHQLVGDYIKRNDVDREWLFPKSLDEGLPDWVTEEGKIRLGTLMVLGRATVAALAGMAADDDPETQARTTLLAAGVGAVLSPKLARILVENLSKPEVREMLRGEIGSVRFPKRAVGENPSPNTGRMGVGVEAKRLIRGINEKLSEARKLDRDTVKPWEQTIAEAGRSPFREVEHVLGLDATKLSLDELDGAVTAARGTRDLVLENVLKSSARAKLTGDATLAAETRQQFLLAGMVSEQVTNFQTAIARGLAAQKITSNPALAAKYDLDLLAKAIEDKGKDLIDLGKMSDIQLVELISKLGDSAAAAKLAEVGSKWPQALWNIYYGLNLLGSPLTQFRNVLGNMGGLAMAVSDRAFGEIIAAPFHAFGNPGGWGKGMVQSGETYELAKGLWQVVGDTFRAAKDAKAVPGGVRTAFADAYRTGQSIYRHGGSKAEEMRTLEQAKELGNGPLAVVIQGMSMLAEKNMRIMGGVDEMFKTLSFQGELRALAQREAKGAGLQGKALATEIERLVDTPTKDMLAAAEAFAHENTFTKAFNPYSEGATNLWGLGGKLEDVAKNPLMRLTVAPFYRTPMRIGEFSSVHTPGLNLLAVQFYSDLAAGGAKANLAWAKLATGSAVIGLVGWYAAHGYITGDWPSDPGLKAAYERTGWKPKSIYLPFLNKYVSYDNFEPLSTLVGTMANVIQMGRDLPEWQAETLMMAGAIAAAKSSISKQWFQGVSDITDVIEGMRQGDSADQAVKWLTNRLVALVPGAAIGRLVANMSDEERRDYKSVTDNEHPELREFETITNRFKAVVPGWSKTRQAIPNMITGEPLPSENSWLGALSPWQFSTVTTGATGRVLRELVALDGAGLPKELPRVIGGTASATPFKFPGDEERMIREGIKLSNEERVRLGVLLTKTVEDSNGENLLTALNSLMDSEEYDDASDGRYGGKSTYVATVFNGFLTQAEAQLREEYPRLDQAILRRKLERDLGKLPKSMEDQKDNMRDMIEELVR